MNWSVTINLIYVLSAVLFILGLKMLGHPSTARQGNRLSALGMFLAVVVTLFNQQIIEFHWIVLGIALGTLVGVAAARLVAMTSMPEMVALLNGLGGASSLLVGLENYLRHPELSLFQAIAIALTVLIGGVTTTGSVVAWAKLKEVMTGRPVLFGGQKIINALLFLAILTCATLWAMHPAEGQMYAYTLVALSTLMGILMVLPIGGADMPVVISLLNSYSGLAAAAAGMAIGNNLLIIAGALVGASGIILTNIMCKAMNRSLSNVLFSGMGATRAASSGQIEGEIRPISAQDTYYLLESARSVLIVPGYGLAVAQAQHAVCELQELLERNGAEVRYGIHPVAGRMPGHMNVLLAEANVSYDLLMEMDDINPTMETVDVCLVIGANDVVNPQALEDKSSPIYGMPIIEVARANTVIVMKRSMKTGFAGVQNPLFFKENTRMLFGDAKAQAQALVLELKN